MFYLFKWLNLSFHSSPYLLLLLSLWRGSILGLPFVLHSVFPILTPHTLFSTVSLIYFSSDCYIIAGASLFLFPMVENLILLEIILFCIFYLYAIPLSALFTYIFVWNMIYSFFPYFFFRSLFLCVCCKPRRLHLIVSFKSLTLVVIGHTFTWYRTICSTILWKVIFLTLRFSTLLNHHLFTTCYSCCYISRASAI